MKDVESVFTQTEVEKNFDSTSLQPFNNIQRDAQTCVERMLMHMLKLFSQALNLNCNSEQRQYELTGPYWTTLFQC